MWDLYKKCREIIGRALRFIHPRIIWSHIRGNSADRQHKKQSIIQEQSNINDRVSKYLENESFGITAPRLSWQWHDQVINAINNDADLDERQKQELKDGIKDSRNIILDAEQFLWRTSNEYTFIPFIIAKSVIYTTFILALELPITIFVHAMRYAVLPFSIFVLRNAWSLTTKAAKYIYEACKDKSQPVKQDLSDEAEYDLEVQQEEESQSPNAVNAPENTMLNQWQIANSNIVADVPPVRRNSEVSETTINSALSFNNG